MADQKNPVDAGKYPVAISAIGDADGGGYMALAVDLKGCMAGGETRAEALENLKSAILEWTDEAVRLGRRVPAPGEAIARAHKEHKSLMDLLQKQDSLLAEQTEAFEKQRDELARLREQLLSLSSQSQSDDAEPDGALADPCLVTIAGSRGGRNNIPH